MAARPPWKKTRVPWDLEVQIWERMASGDSIAEIGRGLDEAGQSLDRRTIRLVREELRELPEETVRGLSEKVQVYRMELRGGAPSPAEQQDLSRLVRIWRWVLPPSASRPKWRVVVPMFIAVVIATSGGFGIWYLITEEETPVTAEETPELKFFVGLAAEEEPILRDIITDFEEDQDVTVQLVNLKWEVALERLNKERADLIALDIVGRRDLVDKGLVEELSEEEHGRLIPAAAIPALLPPLKVNGKRYFMPYRPNVQVVILNRAAFDQEGLEYPETWGEVLESARRFHDRDGEDRVVFGAKDTAVALSMIEVIRAAGGDLLCLRHPQTSAALEFIRELWPYVSPKSLQADYRTTIGLLLADEDYLGRNWSYSVLVINDAGRDQHFQTYAGWRWSEESDPSNLLGGELLALPKNARHKDEAIELIKFLMSKEVQGRFAAELFWPSMRLDVLGAVESWQERHMKVISEALSYADPTPDYWSQDMANMYRRLFQEITSLDQTADVEATLESFQAEIDALGIGGCE